MTVVQDNVRLWRAGAGSEAAVLRRALEQEPPDGLVSCCLLRPTSPSSPSLPLSLSRSRRDRREQPPLQEPGAGKEEGGGTVPGVYGGEELLGGEGEERRGGGGGEEAGEVGEGGVPGGGEGEGERLGRRMYGNTGDAITSVR